VIVADLLTDRRPGSDVIVRHATGEGWLKIGSFKPAGWEPDCDEETRQQDAEERRLLYVALTRARDHLVIPCFPDTRKKAWLDAAIEGFMWNGREPAYGKRSPTIAADGGRGAATVRWFDSRELRPGGKGARRTSRTAAIDGTDADGRDALVAEETWERARKQRRAEARRVARAVRAGAAPPYPLSRRPMARRRPRTRPRRS
jgi:hypothetical protein